MMTTKKMLSEVIAHTRCLNEMHTPEFLDLLFAEDHNSINDLLKLPGLKVYDTIHSQLTELVKSENPARTFTQSMIENEIERHLSGTSEFEYGIWVYYPWSNKLVHTLPENEFVALRTNRNKYKITEKEQEILSNKKVGVIGLSVGQSVSLTMAMERTFGELRIADFDELEITNMNRLRSGVHNMGIRKTILVAREIAEIDPFLKVTCFHEGINEHNLEQFLLENGKLDILIDECDSVDIKISCRIGARVHGIPVVMEASDRGTVDIERYDLDGEYPLLHGYVDHLDLSKAKNLTTNEEKLPFILPIVGIETMSPRLKASSIEVGQTISGWPQLASAVMMGGGITADVCRRILLNQLHVSGRFFVDIEELISDPIAENETETTTEQPAPLTNDRMQVYADQIVAIDANDLELDVSLVRILINAARIAPSAGNNQPWKWFYDKGRLLLFHCREQTGTAGDAHNMSTFLSLGAAIENLSLRAKQMGLESLIECFPKAGMAGDELVAVIRFRMAEEEEQDELVNFLETRCTNRNTGNKKKIPASEIAAISSVVVRSEHTGFRFITDREKIERLAAIIGKTEKLRIFIEQGHKEFFETEIRWTAESAEKTKDGIDLRTIDLSLKDTVGLRLIKDPRAAKLLCDWDAGKAIEKMANNSICSSSGLGLLTIPRFTKQFSLNAGMAMERVWLAATRAGLAVHPFFAPIYHFTLIRNQMGHTLPPAICAQFEVLYDEFASISGLRYDEEPAFLFRFCYADDVKIRTFRFDLEDIFSVGGAHAAQPS